MRQIFNFYTYAASDFERAGELAYPVSMDHEGYPDRDHDIVLACRGTIAGVRAKCRAILDARPPLNAWLRKSAQSILAQIGDAPLAMAAAVRLPSSGVN